jgi:hypothetical protein
MQQIPSDWHEGSLAHPQHTLVNLYIRKFSYIRMVSCIFCSAGSTLSVVLLGHAGSADYCCAYAGCGDALQTADLTASSQCHKETTNELVMHYCGGYSGTPAGHTDGQ